MVFKKSRTVKIKNEIDDRRGSNLHLFRSGVEGGDLSADYYAHTKYSAFGIISFFKGTRGRVMSPFGRGRLFMRAHLSNKVRASNVVARASS